MSIKPITDKELDDKLDQIAAYADKLFPDNPITVLVYNPETNTNCFVSNIENRDIAEHLRFSAEIIAQTPGYEPLKDIQGDPEPEYLN